MAIMSLLIEFKEWAMSNIFLLSISVVVALQFFAIQAFFIHYHLFRKGLKRPKPDALRFAQIEKSIAFQGEQIEKIFEKLADTRKEILEMTPIEKPQAPAEPRIQSFESSFLSLGEINLKKRLDNFRRNV